MKKWRVQSKALNDEWIVEASTRGKAMWRTVNSFVDAGFGDIKAAFKDIRVTRHQKGNNEKTTPRKNTVCSPHKP